MSGALILFGGESPHAPFAWLSIDGEGRALARGRSDDGTAFGGARGPAVLVLSAAEAQLKALDIAARTPAQARAAAPYFFEGALAAEETMHFALGSAHGDGPRLAACMSAARLSTWIDACGAIGAAPEAIYLDVTLWPVAPGAAHVIESESLTRVAAGALGGFAIEPALAPALLPGWLRQAQGVRDIVLSVADARAWPIPDGLSVSTAPAGDVMAVLAQAASSPPAHAPDLMQGPFARAAGGAAPWRIWRFAAALAVLAFGLQLGSLVIDGVRDRRAAAQIMELAEADFRAARPDVRRIVNLRAQVAALSNAARAGAHHPVLTSAAPVAVMIESAPSLRLEEVRHAAPEAVVHLRLSAPQAADLEAAAENLRRQGLSVETRALQASEGRAGLELAVTRR